MNILRQATLDRSNRKKDNSVSLTFITTTEQSTDEFMEIDSATNGTGVLYFKPNGGITQEQIDELDKTTVEVDGKSKSKRLRSTLYIHHKQLLEDKKINKDSADSNFDHWYAKTMEVIITHYKDKLHD